MAKGMTRVIVAMVAGGASLSFLPAPTTGQTTTGQAATAPQDPPPIVVVGPDADIVVIGPQPMLRGGLWQIRRSPTMLMGGGGSIRGFGFTTCLPDDTLLATIRGLAGDRSVMLRNGICTSLKLTVADGRITGRRSCTKPSLQIGVDAATSILNVSGRYDSRRLTIMFYSEDQFNGMERGGGAGWNPQRPTGQRWQATATRIGDCPLARRLDQRTAAEVVTRLFSPFVSPDDD